MKRKGLLAACAFAVFCVGAYPSVELNANWTFTREDPAGAKAPTLEEMSAILDFMGRELATTRTPPPVRADVPDFAYAHADFDAAAWKTVRVPHDFGVDESFSITNAFYDAYLRGIGVGWYRKRVRIEGDMLKVLKSGGKVFFESNGAMSFAMVWINGSFVGGWPYGYTPFRCDLTPHLKADGENLLAVRVHNLPDSSRWYTGAGLYRKCRLVAYPADHIIPGTLFIRTPEVTRDYATVKITYEMSKRGRQEKSFRVKNPRLWDIDDPYLYTVDVEGERVRYGIRMIGFYPDERGFQLNGRRVQLQGVCLHHDFGVLGAAYNHATMKRRLLLLKEAGVNAIRSSHNQSDPDLLDLCDELGLLFKNEHLDQWSMKKHGNDYHRLFDRWAERDLRAFMRCDRNHPCVILWSLGNEITESHRDLPLYTKNARFLNRIAHEEDTTRPTCCANDSQRGVDTNDYVRVTDVFGYNYQPSRYKWFRENHPEVPVFGSEVICLGSTRGEYFFPVQTNYLHSVKREANEKVTSYGFQATGYDLQGFWTPDCEWKFEDSEPSYMGGFTWSGIDYLGGPGNSMQRRKKPNYLDPKRQKKALEEVKQYGYCLSGPHGCTAGFIDTAGFKKDRFYLYQARWRPDLPMAHVLPHWNWTDAACEDGTIGRVGKKTPVFVYTSGDEVELFVNGKPQGRIKAKPFEYRFMFMDVVYEPGVVTAVAYKNGKEWARGTVKTTGPAAKISLEPEKTERAWWGGEKAAIVSDGEEIVCVTLAVRDAEGLLVPNAKNAVKLAIEGPGEIVASDNGDETDFEDFKGMERHVFNGYLSVMIRAKEGAAGKITLKATGPGLKEAETDIEAVRKQGHSALRPS